MYYRDIWAQLVPRYRRVLSFWKSEVVLAKLEAVSSNPILLQDLCFLLLEPRSVFVA